MRLQEIAFNELYKYNDGNSLVFYGSNLTQEETQQATAFFERNSLFPDGSVIEYRRITGSTLGENGRKDVFIRLKDETIINPFTLRRLSGMGIKQTSEFISKHGKDYGLTV